MSSVSRIKKKTPFLAQLTVLAIVSLIVLAPFIGVMMYAYPMVVAPESVEGNTTIEVELDSISSSDNITEIETDQVVSYDELDGQNEEIIDTVIHDGETVKNNEQNTTSMFNSSKTMLITDDEMMYIVDVDKTEPTPVIVQLFIVIGFGTFLSVLVALLILTAFLPLLAKVGIFERKKQTYGEDEYTFVLFD